MLLDLKIKHLLSLVIFVKGYKSFFSSGLKYILIDTQITEVINVSLL